MISIDLSNNGLTILSNISYPTDINILNISNNNLISISDIPTTIYVLYVDNNKNLSSIDLLLNIMLDTLFASHCSLLSNNILLSSSLLVVNLSDNELDDLQFLSPCTQLKKLNVSYNNISSLNYCPNVDTLIINNNSLTTLEFLPISVNILDISNNQINDISYLTDFHLLTDINITNTNITLFTNLPTSCKNIINESTSTHILANIPYGVQLTGNKTVIQNNNKTIILPVPENGRPITNKLTRITKSIYPGNNINISRVSFEIDISEGTIDIKIIFITRKKKIFYTLLNNTITTLDGIYDYPLISVPPLSGTIEIHAKKNTANAIVSFQSCMLY